MTSPENIIGAIAATISITLFIPQAATTWKNRRNPQALTGISVGTQVLVATNALVWFALGWLEENFWISAPGLLNLPLALATLYTLKQHRKEEPCPTSNG